MTLTDDEVARAVRDEWARAAMPIGVSDDGATFVNEWERLAFRAGFAAGLAAIPREPTQAMIDAGSLEHARLSRARLISTWIAMHDAASKP